MKGREDSGENKEVVSKKSLPTSPSKTPPAGETLKLLKPSLKGRCLGVGLIIARKAVQGATKNLVFARQGCARGMSGEAISLC